MKWFSFSRIHTVSNLEPVVVVLLLLLLQLATSAVEAACSSRSVGELWAYSRPGSETFHDKLTTHLTSDRSSECRWVIIASDVDEVVVLNFPEFTLKKSKGHLSGDCLAVYDGKDATFPLLGKICDGDPEQYTSQGRELFVVYHRGEVEGSRSFTMEFKAKDVMTKTKIIRIAGIVGAVLAGIGLIYVVSRVTKCFSCIRGKGSPNENTGREHDRLTTTVVEGNDEGGIPQITTTPASNNNDSGSRPTGGAALLPGENSPSSRSDGLSEPRHGSDSDSVHGLDLNEPPPSYESLYLGDEGQAPPTYTPREHEGRHPPRRVHTFN